MSYYDKTFGNVLPTRNGAATGTANERQMLDRIGGSAGYRKQFQTNPDGSTTMLTTKNGMPQFTTYGETTITATTTTANLYLESGQLEWTFPGEGNPTRFDPAKWHLLDVSETSEYLGYIKSDGEQNNYPALAEGRESQAVGYKKSILTPTSTPAQIAAAALADAASKTAAEGVIVIKKTVASIFPASLFTGKMRLFMQAQYGAINGLHDYPLSVDLLGESVLLYYNQGGKQLQFGFWTHKTPGIHTAEDGSYWLVDLSMIVDAIHITTYPIAHHEEVLPLVTRLKNEALTDMERTQLEAYIFAGSYIDLSKPETQIIPGHKGGAFAYGWKFNSDGSTASVVVHQALGIEPHSHVWNAATIHLSIDAPAGEFSTQIITHGDWTDGWGVYNIFAPYSETVDTLALKSIAIDSLNVMPRFDFSDVSIYGYYKDDEWVDVKLSRSVRTDRVVKQSESGIIYDPTQDMSQLYRYQYGVIPSGSPCTYELHDTSYGYTMNLSVGDSNYAGESEFGTHAYFTRSVSQTGTGSTGLNSNPKTVGSGLYGNTTFAISPPGYPASGQATLANGFQRIGAVTMTMITHSGWHHQAWAFVIPGGDCEAAYVAVHGYDESEAVTKQITTGDGCIGFYGNTDTSFGSPGVVYDYMPWTQANNIGNSYNIHDTMAVATEYPPPPEMYTNVYCYNTQLSGEEGLPGGSYEPLFNVYVSSPYYNRGMYTHTSAGGRFVMSEHPSEPASANYHHRFVGWA